MLEASHVDFRVPVPELTPIFLDTWGKHYSVISELIPPLPEALEIGTGFGILATGMGIITGGPVWTTEHPSREYIWQAEYQSFLKLHNVHITAHDLTEGLPFCTGMFHRIYFCDVIEHLHPPLVKKILREIYRVLNNRGKLIISTPNLNRLSNFIRFIRGHTVNPPLVPEKYGDTFDHFREFAPEELLMLMEECGFIKKSIKFGFNPYFTQPFGDTCIITDSQAKIVNTLTRFLSRIYPPLGDNIYMVVQKN